MAKQKERTKKRMKAKHNTYLQVYPSHHLSKTGTICLANRMASGVYFVHDSRLYPFLVIALILLLLF